MAMLSAALLLGSAVAAPAPRQLRMDMVDGKVHRPPVVPRGGIKKEIAVMPASRLFDAVPQTVRRIVVAGEPVASVKLGAIGSHLGLGPPASPVQALRARRGNLAAAPLQERMFTVSGGPGNREPDKQRLDWNGLLSAQGGAPRTVLTCADYWSRAEDPLARRVAGQMPRGICKPCATVWNWKSKVLPIRLRLVLLAPVIHIQLHRKMMSPTFLPS